MDITAIIGIRNESRYLPITIKHLIDSHIKIIIIDNGSDDNTRNVLNAFKNHINFYMQLPYKGYFDLTEQINIKNDIIENLDTDWVIHQDADEILESPIPNETLREGIERVSKNPTINLKVLYRVANSLREYLYRPGWAITAMPPA